MEIKAPDLGVDSAEVSEIMVAVGDLIVESDNIVLLESDKASMEVPADASGKVTAINVVEGDIVSEGSVLITIEADESASTSEATSEEVTPAPSAQLGGTEATHALPDLGVDSAEVAEILVNVGDTVTAEQSLLLVESDKASVEVPAPVAGTVVKLLVNAGDKVSNGQDFIVIAGNATLAPAETVKTETKPVAVEEPKEVTASTPSAQLTEAEVNASLTDVYAGPAVRKYARQMGIDVTQVKGTGKNNRIQKDDLFSHVKTKIENPTASVAVSGGASVASLPNLPDMSKTDIWGQIERQPLSKLQKVSIPQLNHNTLLPQVTQFDLADITETEDWRGTLKADYKAEGISLTILSFIIKATAAALLKFPKFNSHLSDDNSELLLRKTVHMGIAVATPTGLVVPVIKDAQNKTIKEISIEVGELAKKARDGKLTPKEMTGASFTISSLGNMGGIGFTPLVTWPQVGILGISDADIKPRWNKETAEFEPRLMLPLSMSYDHRVINGADAAIFTRYVANLLADPRKILLG